MLDIRTIRETPDRVREAVRAKNTDPSLVDTILGLDQRRRELIQQTDQLKQRKNEISKQIPELFKSGRGAESGPLKEESRQVGEQLKGLEDELRDLEEKHGKLLLAIPNIPHDSVPIGHDEEANEVIRTSGEPREFDFEPKGHDDLARHLGILDLERGTRISGSGFFALTGKGARLQRALINWMLDTHTDKNGYREVRVPYLVNRATMTGTGQLPKLEDDMYRVESDDLFLIPTAEVPVTNLHRDEILEPGLLPLKYVAYTPCFRREAGSYGKETRGIQRVHQFDKVEMVQIVEPETSYDVLDALTRSGTELVEALGLTYRIVNLCSGDLSFAAAKCFDIEVWAPGMQRWLECSSCSNFEDFQARRANIRFRREQGARPEFPHTLNGSGLALPRIFIAVLENGQQEDGSVVLPPALHPYFGLDRIEA